MCVVLLVAYVALSWSQKSKIPSWSGEDNSTSSMYCAIDRPTDSLKHGEFRLTRFPELHSSLSTILLTPYPRPNIQVIVYDDVSFSAAVLQKEQIWISEARYEEFVQAIADTGLLKSTPTSRPLVDDGMWIGLEHCFSGMCLGYADNSSDVSQQLSLIHI